VHADDVRGPRHFERRLFLFDAQLLSHFRRETAAPGHHRHAESLARAESSPDQFCPDPTKPERAAEQATRFGKSFLFHSPARKAITLSAMRRSNARIKANASSATAIEFLPGQFAT
jgi:hypothetical protein